MSVDLFVGVNEPFPDTEVAATTEPAHLGTAWLIHKAARRWDFAPGVTWTNADVEALTAAARYLQTFEAPTISAANVTAFSFRAWPHSPWSPANLYGRHLEEEDLASAHASLAAYRPFRARWSFTEAIEARVTEAVEAMATRVRALARELAEARRREHSQEAATRAKFERLAREWKQATAFESSVVRAAMHAAYQRIIALGEPAVPLILRELQREPDYWFWALASITGEDPAADTDNLDDATERWLEWGRMRRLLN